MPDSYDDLPDAPGHAASATASYDDLPDAPKLPDSYDDLPDALGKGDPRQPVLSAGQPKPILTRIRESLSPLLGPTPDQVLSDAVPTADGKFVYKPLGGAVDREGFLPALSHPALEIPKAKGNADDALITAVAKGVYNTGAGFAEFMESPLGAATMGAGSLAMIPKGAVASSAGAIEAARVTGNLGKVIAGGYAADMAAKVPELAARAGTASVTGTPQEQVEADLGLAANLVLPATLAAHATGLPRLVADKLGANPAEWTAADLATEGRLKAGLPTPEVSEFGGEAATPVAVSADYADLPNAVQTSELPAAAPAPEVGAEGSAPAATPEETPAGLEQRLSNWADATIAEGRTRLNVGLDPTLLAAYGVKGALLIKNGIADFGRWSGAMVREFGEAIRPHLAAIFDHAGGLAEGEGLRAFGQKLQQDQDVAAAVKESAQAYIYDKRSNETDQQTAERLQEHGIDAATQLFQDERAAMPQAVRTLLGTHLIKTIGAQERLARSKGDSAGADVWLSKQTDVADLNMKRSTELAQGLQALSVYGDLTPEGMLRSARRTFGDAGQRELDRLQPVTDQLKNGMRAANDAAVQATVADPKVNEAARAAVNEHIENSPATHRGVVVDVAGVFADSPEVMRQARELFRGRVAELQRKNSALANRSKAELGVIFDDLAKRAAGIAAAHYQGAELGKTLAQKLSERLGLSEDAAGRLAKSLDLQFGKMVAAARAKIPERIAAMRARQASPFDPEEFSQSGIDREIRGQLREMNLRLGDLVKQHSSAVDATGRGIGERVVADSGLTGPRADALQAAFEKRFQELATAQKARLLKQLEQAGVKVPGKLKSAIGDLIKMTNLGAFRDAKWTDMLRKRLDLPVLTDELKREIVRRANEVQALPEGFQRDRASVKLLDYIAGEKGLKWWELPQAVWFAHALSSFTTPMHIMFDNIPGVVGNAFVAALRQPAALGDIVKGLTRGQGKGLLQAQEVLKTGVVTGIKPQLLTGNVLELDPFKGPLALLNYEKYVGRGLSATHVLMFKPAFEMKSALVARDVAIKEGLSGSALQQRVADILGNTEARVNAAKAEAVGEGLTGLDQRRRTVELLEQQREQAAPGITDTARQYALRATYLNEPYGALGAGLAGLQAGFKRLEELHPVGGFLARIVTAPFARIATNIINEKLNWSPIGAYRAVRGMRGGELYGEPITDPRATGDLLVKSMVGTALTAGLTAAAAQYLHDPDPKFAITGNGPVSLAARKQLQATGWKPHSLKIGGVYLDFERTPLAIPLNVVGNYLDALKYRHLDQRDALQRAAFAMKGAASSMLNQSYLQEGTKTLSAIMDENDMAGGQKLIRSLATAGAPLAAPRLLMSVDRLFDPTKYDGTDIESMLRAQLPFVRRENRPVLNVLGEPVQMGVFDRDIGEVKPDPLWRVLAAKQAWISEPSRETIIGDRRRGPDYYRTLTADELYDYTRQSGQAIRERLRQNLDQLQDLDTVQAKVFVGKIVQEERAKAKQNFGR